MMAALAFIRGVPWQAWALIACLALVWQVDSRAYDRGRKAEQEAARIAAGKRIVEMEKTNEAFRSLPALDRCRAFMRDSGLSIDNCQ